MDFESQKYRTHLYFLF